MSAKKSSKKPAKPSKKKVVKKAATKVAKKAAKPSKEKVVKKAAKKVIKKAVKPVKKKVVNSNKNTWELLLAKLLLAGYDCTTVCGFAL